MMQALMISAAARMSAERGPVVELALEWPGMAMRPVLSLGEAETAYDAIGAAIGAIKLGASYAARTDPRNVERLYRAKLAVRLGLPPQDVREVFDLDAAAYARLVAEVLG